MTGSLVEVRGLSAAYGGDSVLRDITLRINEGERWAIIGRNGTGKSTLIKALAGLLAPRSGTVSIRGKSIGAYSGRERARHIAYVPQQAEAVIPYRVHDFVMLGRYARMGLFGVPVDEDRRAVSETLEVCDIRGLGNRMVSSLSGGEMQRVLLAGAVAQETGLLLLDEPTTFLDPAHQKHFLSALEKAGRNRPITTVMVTHDINSALCSCTHILALEDGAAFFAGRVEEFVESCPAVLRRIFHISFTSFESPEGNKVFGTWGGGSE